MKWATISMLAAALSGCSDKFDGSYEGSPFESGWSSVMQVAGNEAVFKTFETDRPLNFELYGMTVDMRNGLLHLVRYDGVVFVYGLDADDMSLDCLSDSCRGEERGMPSSWKPVKQ